MDASRSRGSVNLAFAALMVSLLLAALDQTVVATALPTIVDEIGGLTQLSWVVTAYLLAATVTTPIFGKLGDLFGRKLMLQSAVVAFTVGSLFCGLAQSMDQLIAARALQGVGGGGLLVTIQATIADLVPLRARGRYQAWTSSVFGIATVLGPLFGGVCVELLSWRWIFIANLPLGLIALSVISVVLVTPKKLEIRPKVDYLGAGLLGGALTAIVLLCTLGGQTYAWSSWQMIGLLSVVLLLGAAFFAVERAAADAILPSVIVTNPTARVGIGLGFTMGVGLMAGVTYLPIYLQLVKGLAATSSGAALIPLMGGLFVTSIIVGRIVSHTGRYRTFPIVGLGLSAAAALSLALAPRTASIGFTIAGAALWGGGLGMAIPVVTVAVQNAVPRHQLGAATAGLTLMRSAGSSLGVAVFGAILSAQLGAHRAAHRGGELGSLEVPASMLLSLDRGLHLVFAATAAVLVAGSLLAFALEDIELKHSSAEPR